VDKLVLAVGDARLLAARAIGLRLAQNAAALDALDPALAAPYRDALRRRAGAGGDALPWPEAAALARRTLEAVMTSMGCAGSLDACLRSGALGGSNHTGFLVPGALWDRHVARALHAQDLRARGPREARLEWIPHAAVLARALGLPDPGASVEGEGDAALRAWRVVSSF
jgi:hypothetical protein